MLVCENKLKFRRPPSKIIFTEWIIVSFFISLYRETRTEKFNENAFPIVIEKPFALCHTRPIKSTFNLDAPLQRIWTQDISFSSFFSLNSLLAYYIYNPNATGFFSVVSASLSSNSALKMPKFTQRLRTYSLPNFNWAPAAWVSTPRLLPVIYNLSDITNSDKNCGNIASLCKNPAYHYLHALTGAREKFAFLGPKLHLADPVGRTNGRSNIIWTTLSSGYNIKCIFSVALITQKQNRHEHLPNQLHFTIFLDIKSKLWCRVCTAISVILL